MIPLSIRRVLVLIACAVLLQFGIGQLNHALAWLALTLSAPGLLVVFAALRLPANTGLTVAFLSGLLIDAQGAAAFGRNAFLLGLAFCLLHRYSARLPRESALVGVVAAVFLNLALVSGSLLLELGDLPDPASGALRLLADLLASQVLTVLVGPWFLALQSRSLSLAGALPETRVPRFA